MKKSSSKLLVMFFLLIGLLLFISSIFATPNLVNAVPLPVYAPPNEIEVTMYALNDNGDIRDICTPGDIRYGCTAYCRDPLVNPSRCHPTRLGPYPYSSNPAVVHVEDDYLLDVLAKEVSPESHHPNAIEAQAFAARTFAYYFDNYSVPFNNSIESQAFVPYAFDSIGYSQAEPGSGVSPCDPELVIRNVYQQRICNATANRRYISYNYTQTGGDLPSFTEFSSDTSQTINRTVAGFYQNGDPIPNLLAVDDPITTVIDVQGGGHGRGMSQNGASRWAYGNLGYAGSLEPWSVRWNRTEQIIVHYYANSHIRYAVNAELDTSFYRWNPLSIDWGVANPGNSGLIQMQPGESYDIHLIIQNTGVEDWFCGGGYDYLLHYFWVWEGNPGIGSTYASVCNVLRADPSAIIDLTVIAPNNPDTYSIQFDIYQYDLINKTVYRFSEPDATGNRWPMYSALVCVSTDGNCGSVFLPIFSTGATTR